MNNDNLPPGLPADPNILNARLKRLARHRARSAQTPSLADPRPQGSGPLNRHGMPRLPVGQTDVDKWPVLDMGVQPALPPTGWRLVVDGSVARPLVLDLAALRSLPQIEDVSDFHCVTTWSKMDLRWLGVRVATLLALAEPLDSATHVMCHGYDGYTTNLPLEEVLKDDVLVAHTVEGAPLSHEHGGPVRMVTPQLYAWKGAKWLSRIEVLAGDQPGFWEQRGYSNTAYPWRDDRFG